ncbi:MAG: 3-isopropylmalate dehydratase small subunit [Planctomycetaceae bacterium]
MQPFVTHNGLVAAMDRSNVDTDQIIPKQFLKRIERTGFGQFLFFDWRFLPDGTPDPSFELNRPEVAGASILLARRNFGCGSSREHAPWALADYGFRVILAPSFADIFYSNCFQNGMLPVALPDAEIDELFGLCSRGPLRLEVDLTDCRIRDGAQFEARFELDAFRRRCLIEGLDSIGMTLSHAGEIEAWEASHEKPTGVQSAVRAV